MDGKLVEPKVAVPRKTNPKLVMRTKKIFVGGLSATTSLEDIRAYFEQFSKVKEAMLAYDKVTSRHRGFGFVTFDNEDVVDKICEIHFHEINGIIRFIVVKYELFYREDCKFSIYFYNFFFSKGKMVESKKALPKEPRLSFYSSYTSQYYGGQGGQLSPPGARNYYGPNPYQGMYMNGNRYYQQQHNPSQVFIINMPN